MKGAVSTILKIIWEIWNHSDVIDSRVKGTGAAPLLAAIAHAGMVEDTARRQGMRARDHPGGPGARVMPGFNMSARARVIFSQAGDPGMA